MVFSGSTVYHILFFNTENIKTAFKPVRALSKKPIVLQELCTELRANSNIMLLKRETSVLFPENLNLQDCYIAKNKINHNYYEFSRSQT